MDKKKITTLLVLLLTSILVWELLTTLRSNTQGKRVVRPSATLSSSERAESTRQRQRFAELQASHLANFSPHQCELCPPWLTNAQAKSALSAAQWHDLADSLSIGPEDITRAQDENDVVQLSITGGNHHVSVGQLQPDGSVKVTCHNTLGGVVEALGLNE